MLKAKETLLYRTLKVTFAYPIVVLMKGGWRFGKTDTSFLCAYLAKKWGIIDRIGSNAYTYNNPMVDEVTDLQTLRFWLHQDKTVKLFIFDEALKHAYRRRAMSAKNVGIIEILAELSKGHGRMIACTQIESIDSDLIDPVFCRSEWEKINKKTMVCESKHHSTRTFRNLPKSPIRFDPDRLAPFTDKKMSKMHKKKHKGKVFDIVTLRLQGWSLNAIGDKYSIQPTQVRREIRKALKEWVEERESVGEENGRIQD